MAISQSTSLVPGAGQSAVPSGSPSRGKFDDTNIASFADPESSRSESLPPGPFRRRQLKISDTRLTYERVPLVRMSGKWLVQADSISATLSR